MKATARRRAAFMGWALDAKVIFASNAKLRYCESVKYRRESNYTRRMGIQVTDAQRSALERIADQRDHSMSRVVRDILAESPDIQRAIDEGSR